MEWKVLDAIMSSRAETSSLQQRVWVVCLKAGDDFA